MMSIAAQAEYLKKNVVSGNVGIGNIASVMQTITPRHVEYIHYNPVKHGYVSQAAAWPYSSIHRYIAAGIIPPDWGNANQDYSGQYGER